MKWFQVDSNTPSDPKVRRVLREFGNGGFGALVRLWCFVAEHGGKVGYSVDGQGRPYPVEDLAAAMGSSVAQARRLIGVCAETGHVTRSTWLSAGVVHLPALERRADQFTRRQERLKEKTPPTQPMLDIDYVLSTDPLRSDAGFSTSTRQDNTKQHNTNNTTAHARRATRALLETWFDESFWPTYPSGYRGGKPAALKAVLKFSPDEAARAAMLAGLARWIPSRKWTEGFIPNCSTFVNQRLFDEVPPVIPVKAPPPSSGRTGAPAPGKYDHVMRRATPPTETH